MALGSLVRKGNMRSFSQDSLNLLSSIMKDQLFARKSYLFWEGDLADKLYFVKSGSIKITKTTDEGKELTLYVYQAGDLICHANPLERAKHTFTAEVIANATISVMDQTEVEKLISEHPSLSLDFIKWMGNQHLLTQFKLRDLMFYGKQAALSSTLIRLSNSYGEKVGDHIHIRKKLTHLELSNMISATRESVNRMIIDLRNNDILEYKDGTVIIKDLSYLQEICHCESCTVEICRM